MNDTRCREIDDYFTDMIEFQYSEKYPRIHIYIREEDDHYDSSTFALTISRYIHNVVTESE